MTASVMLVVGAAATMGLRKAFDRPGETALDMVPKEALGVIVVDIQPSVGQLGAFRKLAGALSKLDVGKSLDSALTDWLGKHAWVADVVPHVRHSGVFVAMPSEERDRYGTPGGMAIFPIDDPEAVKKLLGDHLTKKGEGFVSKETTGVAEVFGDVLIVASDEDDIRMVKSTAEGKHASFVSNEAYREARKSIERDANLMVIVSSESFRMAGRNVPSQVAEALESPGWFSFGIAIRDDGLSTTAHLPVNPRKWEPYKQLAKMAPIRPDLLDRLPSGAYDVMALSQPAQLWRFSEDLIAGDSSSRRMMLDVAESIDRQVGLDIEGSVLPALSGNVVYASYPSEGDAVEGYDALVIADDSNGAKPAEIADRLRRFAARELEKNGEDRIFEDFSIGSHEGYGLSRTLRLKMEDELMRNAPSEQRRLMRGKTFNYVVVGNAVIASTSEDLLKRAVESYEGGGRKLGQDDVLAKSSQIQIEDAQFTYAIDLRRVSQAVNTSVPWRDLDKKFEKAGRGAIEIFGGFASPASLSIRCAENSLTARAFIPLDYDRIADFIKTQQPQFDEMMRQQRDERAKYVEYSRASRLATAATTYSTDENQSVLLPDEADEAILAHLITRTSSGDDEDLSPRVPNGRWVFNPALRKVKIDWITSVPPREVPWFYASEAWPDGQRTVVFVDGRTEHVSQDTWRTQCEPNLKPGLFTEPAEDPGDEPDPAVTSPAASEPAPSTPDPIETLILQAELRTLTPADLASVATAQLRFVRNGIFARHGYIFESEDLRSYFGTKAWYQPSSDDMEVVSSRLNATEKENCKTILQAEGRG